MIQPTADTYRFDLGGPQYVRVCRMGWLFFLALVVCAIVSIVAGCMIWGTYTHTFTFYLKWQDALVALSWFISCVTIGGSILTGRFLYALWAGYSEGMVTFEGRQAVIVRDLSPENLKSIFWIMNSAFWCFVVALIGLVPAILINWTTQLNSPALAVLTTGLAIVLSLAGLVVSIISCSFIIIGFVGGVTFCRKLGSSHVYQLNGQATIRIDDFVLTIIYPSHPESMVDLNLLSPTDQHQLLELLRRRWMDAERAWNPGLGEEIEQALEEADQVGMLIAG